MHRRNLTSKVSKRKVPEHVKIWEEFMEVEVPFDDEGRRCVIHHCDQNPSNNDIHNLVCMTRSEHARWHSAHRTEETLKKKSRSMKGKNCVPCSDDKKKKISDSKKGKPAPWNSHPMDEKTKKKLSESLKGRRLSEEHKKNISKGMKKNPL